MSLALLVFIVAFEAGLLAGVQLEHARRKRRRWAPVREYGSFFARGVTEGKITPGLSRCFVVTTKTRALAPCTVSVEVSR